MHNISLEFSLDKSIFEGDDDLCNYIYDNFALSLWLCLAGRNSSSHNVCDSLQLTALSAHERII